MFFTQDNNNFCFTTNILTIQVMFQLINPESYSKPQVLCKYF